MRINRDVGDGDSHSDVCQKQPYVEQQLEDLHDASKVVVAAVSCNLDAVSRENLTVLEG